MAATLNPPPRARNDGYLATATSQTVTVKTLHGGQTSTQLVFAVSRTSS